MDAMYIVDLIMLAFDTFLWSRQLPSSLSNWTLINLFSVVLSYAPCLTPPPLCLRQTLGWLYKFNALRFDGFVHLFRLVWSYVPTIPRVARVGCNLLNSSPQPYRTVISDGWYVSFVLGSALAPRVAPRYYLLTSEIGLPASHLNFFDAFVRTRSGISWNFYICCVPCCSIYPFLIRTSYCWWRSSLHIRPLHVRYAVLGKLCEIHSNLPTVSSTPRAPLMSGSLNLF